MNDTTLTFQVTLNGVPSEVTVSIKPLAAAPAYSPAAPAPSTSPLPAPVASPAPSPSAAPLPPPAPQPPTVVADVDEEVFLQVGNYWVNTGVWGAGQLVPGIFTDISGSQYEQFVGVGKDVGPNGEVSWRAKWGWPTGTTEVKSYPSVLAGAKPGFANSWICPGGKNIILPDGSTRQVAPSGPTPDTWMPVQLPLPPTVHSTFAYRHISEPTGRGHVTFDLWLQSKPEQAHGWGEAPITHEIMIPLDYWGDYGAYGKRKREWYDHDVTLDGRLWHVYCNKDADGGLRPTFGGRWKWIVFEPDTPVQSPGTISLATFVNYLATQKDALGVPWANGNEWLVSAELGIEPQDGTGDIEFTNYKIVR